ncbi:MAG TPA: hypothetical protein PKY86_01395 [Niabella sp.]|nr:hypothetical protein [Niabella sp.]HQW16274.1 hypothetical protein [Niabella sp.]HQX21494.1 hypothetical protein [Niabella sp.]HRB36092.1 hypothetical protein [Niabella sp.]HRB50021.1 hypothetical protein [Niabella sp.]
MPRDIFRGIEKSEVEEFGKRLAIEKERDQRFAAIQIKGDRLTD